MKETFDPQGRPITPVAQFTFQVDGSFSVQNDSSGHAQISDVSPGTHTVSEIVPSGWAQVLVTPLGGVVFVPSGHQCATVIFKDQQNVPAPVPTPNPPVCTLTAHPSSLQSGGSTTLTWTSSNATSATLSSFGAVAQNGTMTVQVAATAQFLLTVTNAANQSVVCAATITVAPPNIPNTGGTNNLNGNDNSIDNSGNSTNANTITNSGNSSISGSGNSTNTITVSPTISPVFNVRVPAQQYYMQQPMPYFFQQQQQYLPPQPIPIPQPLAIQQQQQSVYSSGQSVALTSIPYTGFDYGPFGNMLYWLALLALSASAAYLSLYFAGDQVRGFHRRQAMMWQRVIDQISPRF